MLVFFTKSSFVKFQPKAFYHFYGFPEATVCRYSSKQMFVEVLQNSQENIYDSLFFNILDLRPEFCKILRTPPLSVSGFQLFYTRSLLKSVWSELMFLKATFLILHFPYQTLMVFLMMLSLTLLSALMIIASILNAIGLLIFGNNQSQLLNPNLGYGTLWTGVEIDWLISMLRKLNLFHIIFVKVDRPVFDKK